MVGFRDFEVSESPTPPQALFHAVWRRDAENCPFSGDYPKEGPGKLMKLSVRSFETSVSFDIKDIDAFLFWGDTDLFLNAFNVKAVECQLTLSTVGPYRATDSEVIRINSVHQVGATSVFHIVTYSVYRILVLIDRASIRSARVTESGPDANQ